MAYDDYRYATPATPYNPYALTSSPQNYYAPSSSVWGNMMDRAVEGSAFTGPGAFGGAGVLSGLGVSGGAREGLGQASLWSGGGPFSTTGLTSMGLGSFWHGMGGMGALKSGEFFKNLGSADAWRNVATFGRSGAKDKQREAEEARRRAVSEWRAKQMQAMGAKLGQAGVDVSADLGSELQQALYAGGEMGDQNAIQDAMTKFQQRYQQYMLGRQRAGQARKVELMFQDPARAADRARRIGAARTQGLAGLAERYRIGQRENAFNQARRGTMGSSMDVEQRGELARGRDQGAQMLQAGLDERARQYRLQDQQQRNQLMGLIYSDDPNTAAALSRTLEGLNQQGALVRENEAMRAQGEALNRATAQNYSQAVGGLLTSASRPLEYYISHEGAGA